MAEVVINAERFFERVERLQSEWMSHKSTTWGGSDALCIPLGSATEDLSYSKSSALHIYLFGYEFPDSLILLTRNNFYFMATVKKCSYLQKDLVGKNGAIQVHILERGKDEGLNREFFNSLIGAVRKGGGKKLGTLKGEFAGAFIPIWLEFVQQSQIETFEISEPLGSFFAIKDDTELDMCKRAAVLSNKVMKHGFVQEMEKILDEDSQEAHSAIAEKVEALILDPSKIGIKVAPESVDLCFAPIIQSGGNYDIRVSATSDNNALRPDVIICSLGARYKGYCANISRTFLVDAPPRIENTYAALLALFNACLEKMVPGNEMKAVAEEAKSFLALKHKDLAGYLPKSFGFAIGLEFRDKTLVLNSTNTAKFAAGMVINLSVGFHNVPLSDEDKSGSPESIKKLSAFSMLLADVVVVQKDGVPEILTKLSKEFSDISYNIGDKDDDGDDGEDDEEDEEGGPRRSKRSKEERALSESAAAKRQQRQQELMSKKLDEARRRIKLGDSGDASADAGPEVEAKDLAVYKSPSEFPRDTLANRLKVDLDKEALLVPINGVSVPFHISTIKNMTQPDPDMRINFYIPGSALGKEVGKNMQQLIVKYGGKSVFIKELTFRSGDGKNLSTVYQQFQELRRRVRQREQKAEQEKDLVVQTKLIRIKDQRVPRLQEVTMRPQLSGRKCVGTLEAHQNGLRFTSSKAETLDVMYPNIKHAIFQPCDRTTMVLVHFHLKDFIMIGKKKQRDVQFYTEVIDASLNLEGARRSSYDPDELDDEQRERELRKRLNLAFKDFCSKVEKVAAHYDFNLQIDVPFKKSGFEGNWSKEMVLLQPTTNCLVNLTEWPPLVLTLNEVEHCHFERVTYATKNFDLTFIFKNWDLAPRTITAIDMKYMDIIQDWLNLVEITYTKGPKSFNWTDIMKYLKEERATFYDDVDEDGEKKPAGWLFLSAEGDDEEEGEEADDGDSSFDEDEDSSEESESEEESDFDEDEDEEDSDDYEDDDDLEEKGQTWEELEREAKISDKNKRAHDEEEEMQARKKQKKR